jgi:hypothetical protein
MSSAFGVREVTIAGFRSARSVSFAPGAVCALVGGPSVGKSNVLEAIWRVLQRGAPAPSAADVSADGTHAIAMRAALSDGEELTLEVTPGGSASASGGPVPVLFLPASLRSGPLLASQGLSKTSAALAARYLPGGAGDSPGSAAAALLDAVERMCADGVRGLVLIVEEPELFLRPQAQRFLYRRLRAFAHAGNQVLYSTHAPAFLNVGRMEELALVEDHGAEGTVIIQPQPLDADEAFRAVSELDAERAELLLASVALLVEGRTEKLSLPFVFRALGHDPDREAVSIVDCGGKPNIPLFIRICHAARVPCVVVHDRDAFPGRRPSHAEGLLNAEIARLAGPHNTIELAPDFEGVAGLRGSHHKPAHAWHEFAARRPDRVPRPLVDAVERVLALAAS